MDVSCHKKLHNTWPWSEKVILAMSDLQGKGVRALQKIILAYREQSEDTASKLFDGSKHVTSSCLCESKKFFDKYFRTNHNF